MGKVANRTRKKAKRVASYSSSSHFADDLLVSVLSKLQDKTLCKFKCVSKSWHSLIEDQVVIEKSKLSTAPFILDMFVFKLERFVHYHGEESDDEEAGNEEAVLHVHVYSIGQDGFATHLSTHNIQERFYNWSDLKFINGLISYKQLSKLSIYNPATGEVIRLPIQPGDYGVEFDPASKEYKLLFNPLCKWNRSFFVRTLGVNDSWRSRGNLTINWGDYLAVHGTLFWFLKDNSEITSFNLSEEAFRTNSLPKKIKGKKGTYYYKFEYGGCLCLVEQPRCQATARSQLQIANMWMLKDIKNNTWVKLMENAALPVEGTTLCDYFSSQESDNPRVNCKLLSQGDEILVVMRDHTDQYIFVYSFLNAQFRRIKITGLPFFPTYIGNHVENYTSLSELAKYLRKRRFSTRGRSYGALYF